MNRLLLGTALAGTLALIAPAFAQNVYHTNPTPAERTQTNTLNSDAADDATDADDTDADDNAATTAKPNADYNAARSDYDRKIQENQADRAAYERDRARYHAERAGYVHRWDAFYGYSRFRGVDGMSESDLVGLRVNARAGIAVGRIRDVDVDRDGHVTRVAVHLRGGDVAWLDPDDLRFDPAARVAVTDLTRDQVYDMSHTPSPRF
ncbi:MAG: hypothetical protein WDM91_19565 [Rhizomicrobium sp.]